MTYLPLTDLERRRLEEARNSLAIGLVYVGWVAEELQLLMLREYLSQQKPQRLTRRTAA